MVLSSEEKVSMEEIKMLIKEMFEEERKEREKRFKKFEESALQIISANQTIMNDRIDKISLEISDINKKLKNYDIEKRDLKDSIETHQNIVDGKLEEVKNHVRHNEENSRSAFDKLRVLEDRSRRNNIRIDGIKENDGETWDECEVKVKSFLKNSLGIDNIHIERAHRVKSSNKNKNTPKTIVAKLLSWKDKSKIIKSSNKLKNSGYFINEDFSAETMEIRKNLRKEVKLLREQGKYAVLKYDTIFSRDFIKRN